LAKKRSGICFVAFLGLNFISFKKPFFLRKKALGKKAFAIKPQWKKGEY